MKRNIFSILLAIICVGSAVAQLRVGNFVVDGKTLSIDAFGDVIIDTGFIANNGADISITTKGNVIIKGGEILGGSTLNIKANKYEIQKDFYVSGNSKINLLTN